MSEYVDGNGFKDLCDCSWNEEIPDKKCIILYANTHDRFSALDLINQNKSKKFILVTHNSDDAVEKTEIPNNLIRWFGTNINYKHDKIEPIPIGLENENWHPNKRNVLKELSKNNHIRRNKAFAQFNPITYPLERVPIIRDVITDKIYANQYYCVNGERFESYADNLTRYKYCLCPRGNGIDTHRLWESLYLGCIPIVKKHITHIFDEYLPILFIDSWSQVTEDFLESQNINQDYNLKILSMSYWKDKIYNETHID